MDRRPDRRGGALLVPGPRFLQANEAASASFRGSARPDAVISEITAPWRTPDVEDLAAGRPLLRWSRPFGSPGPLFSNLTKSNRYMTISLKCVRARLLCRPGRGASLGGPDDRAAVLAGKLPQGIRCGHSRHGGKCRRAEPHGLLSRRRRSTRRRGFAAL